MFGFFDTEKQLYELRKETERLKAENQSLTEALLELAEMAADCEEILTALQGGFGEETEGGAAVG